MVNRQDIERTPGADRSNSLAMITDYVPELTSYTINCTSAVGTRRPGRSTGWRFRIQYRKQSRSRRSIRRTSIISRCSGGSYEADQGDRTYGVFNVVPRTGFERDNQGELSAECRQLRSNHNDYLSVGSHTDRFAYYASVNGNRSGLGIETPVAQIIHDAESGYGAFSTLVLDATPDDQIRFVFSRAP